MSGRGYIGGAHIAAILGVSPFMTPLDAYYSITGERDVSPSDDKRSFFDRRKAWEPMATACFEGATGIKVVRRNHRYDDSVFPWAKAEIDFETEDDSNGETKTCRPDVAWMWGTPGLEEPPMYVTAQAMWGLGIHPKPQCYVHRFDLDDDAIYHVARDDDLIHEIRERALHFWRHHIEKKRAPQPTNVEDVLKLYGRGTERAVEATDDVIKALEARAAAKKKQKLLDAEFVSADFTIKNHMRDASALTVRGKLVATWKADKRGIRTFRHM